MSIIMISSLSHSGRERLARILSQKTGWPVLSREELVDQAAIQGIKTGRLEVSVIKTPGVPERLAREKVLYLAYMTAAICEKARDGNLIYHGRAGHLLLPGVSHRLRIGLTVPLEIRIQNAMATLKISEEKAMVYLDQLDEDLERWIRKIHNMDSREPGQYDFLLNLENMSMGNAATLICQMAEMPDFKPTPAGVKLLQDQYLAAQAKLKLGFDDRTSQIEPEVRADNGILTVTYPPRLKALANDIPVVLEELDGLREIRCTMAETNILWVQEKFNPESENFEHINQLAQRWGAAVELLHYIPLGGELTGSNPVPTVLHRPAGTSYDGGVEDDLPETPNDEAGLIETSEELIALGRFGGQRTVQGSHDRILEAVSTNGHYSLVLIGDMFLSKGQSTRTRQTRELTMAIRDRLKAPVIMVEEMKSRFLFGPKQAIKLAGFSALTLLIYFLVFSNQWPIMNLLGGEPHEKWKLVTSVCLALFVPLVAYIYSSVTGLLLKLINID